MATPSSAGAGAPRPGRVRPALVVVGVTVIAVATLVVLATVRDVQRRGLPTPSFPSLIDAPDAALHGTVAFISEAKHPGDPVRQACARVALASGAAARDVYCWPIDEPAQATAVWTDDGRLLVTSFLAPDDDGGAPVPQWGRYVDVAAGSSEEVPADRLGLDAEPGPGPRTNADGQRLLLEGREGDAVIHLFGPGDEERNLLEVTDANPSWSIQSGPVWSPDFAWVLSWDGGLLVTTTDDERTRTLAAEASASPFGFDQPNFSILDRDLDLG